MSSLVVLVGPYGQAQLSMQLLCDGSPMRAVSQVDPATNCRNLRFVAPSSGGRITMLIHNGATPAEWPRCGLQEGAFFELERAEMGPKDRWDCEGESDQDLDQDREARVGKNAYVLDYGESATLERDESTGGRSILVEKLRDAQGRCVSEVDADVRGLRRTKWRLGVWPRLMSRESLMTCAWCVFEAKLDHNMKVIWVPSENSRLGFAGPDAWLYNAGFQIGKQQLISAGKQLSRHNVHFVGDLWGADRQYNHSGESSGKVRPTFKLVLDDDGNFVTVVAAPEGAKPIAAPPTQQPASPLAVGKIVSGPFVSPPRTQSCQFNISTHGSPKLEFEVFVDMQ